MGWTGGVRTSLAGVVRKASFGPSSTAGRTIVASGKARRTAALPMPRTPL